MAELNYIDVDRGLRGLTGIPRLAVVRTVANGGADEVTVQDFHDTLNSNTLPAGDADDSLDNMDDDFLTGAEGKGALGSGREVGITATLFKTQLAFEGNYISAEEGSATTADAAGETLIDAAAQFITNNVQRGAVIINFTDKSLGEVLKVNSETSLEHRPLQDGTDNDWDLNDEYKIYNIIRKKVTGGNLVAVDDDAPYPTGTAIEAIYPTFATQVTVELDVSAALIPGQSGLQPGDAADIADAVLDEAVADHLTAGSLGRFISDIQDGVIVAAAVVTAGSTPGVVNTDLAQADDFFNGHSIRVYDASGVVTRETLLYLNNTNNGSFSVDEPLPYTPVPGQVVLVLARRESRRGRVV